MHLYGDKGCRGRAGKLKGGKAWRRLSEKRRGVIASLYLADRRASRLGVSDAIPATAGGEGAAKADPVIQHFRPFRTTVRLHPPSSGMSLFDSTHPGSVICEE